jgi:hypothetical protein
LCAFLHKVRIGSCRTGSCAESRGPAQFMGSSAAGCLPVHCGARQFA